MVEINLTDKECKGILESLRYLEAIYIKSKYKCENTKTKRISAEAIRDWSKISYDNLQILREKMNKIET